MAITEAFANTQAVVATEHSCLRDATYDIAQPQTDDGVYQAFFDVSDMVAGDLLEIRVYEKVQAADTQRVLYLATLVGAQGTPIFVLPSLVLINGWDITLKGTAASITVTWSIRKVV